MTLWTLYFSAEVEKRRSSVVEDRGLSSKAIATEAGQEDEEDMEVDDETSAVCSFSVFGLHIYGS